jgi:hypothetical protein
MTKKVATRPWREIRAKKFSAAEIAELDSQIEDELLEMDLREIRELSGKTQADIARAAEMTQSEVSRLERRGDHRLSTLQRFVRAAGGELEVWARIGDRSVRLRAVG